MRKFTILFALLVLVLAALPAAAQEPQVAVTLERTPCFGACPVYTVTIYTDGTVVYNGQRFVTVEGEQTTAIGSAAVEQLVAGFEAAGYFGWEDEYTDMFVTDQSTVTTSVTRDGETKQIVHYLGDNTVPVTLPYLEAWIDMVASTAQWTGATTSFANLSFGQSPVITLERQPCFGTCPVYTISVFEDGTVVYLGINHVAVTGVQTSQIDPSDVEWLVREVELFYFSWEDEYTLMLVTDQPYVITSLTTDNNSKRIVRYDGDQNAPIGLVRFENRIDRVTNSAQWVQGNTGDTE